MGFSPTGLASWGLTLRVRTFSTSKGLTPRGLASKGRSYIQVSNFLGFCIQGFSCKGLTSIGLKPSCLTSSGYYILKSLHSGS